MDTKSLAQSAHTVRVGEQLLEEISELTGIEYRILKSAFAGESKGLALDIVKSVVAEDLDGSRESWGEDITKRVRPEEFGEYRPDYWEGYASSSTSTTTSCAQYGGFSLIRERVSRDTPEYLEDPEARRDYDPPYDAFRADRLLIHWLMRRLAFEDGQDWLVEALEVHRESVAAQAAYALALERESGVRRVG